MAMDRSAGGKDVNREDVGPERNRADLDARVREYWNAVIHDAGVTRAQPGTHAFFSELEAYRFEKLDYLPRVVDFAGWHGRDVLEVGCGTAIDLVRFALGGARVTGIDVSDTAIALSREHLCVAGVKGTVLVADGARLPFASESFDLVYCHGVLPYASDPHDIAHEARRVLQPGGAAIFMAYNRRSWLSALSRWTAVELHHADAPVFRMMTRAELDDALAVFEERRIVPERFPVRSRLQRGWKGALFNRVFVPAFGLLPRNWVRPYGFHLMAYCRKTD
jgi:ubiquinone/menaquinone biosynthesis C-methylase UbiE